MIFCVEDDNSIRQLEIYALEGAGLSARGFSDAESLWNALSGCTPELILLDIMLQGEDGLSILRRLRANRATALVPVLIASAKGAEYDKVLGLDSGADDYIAKPFGMMELVARVKALRRRTDAALGVTDTLSVGSITLHTAQHKVYVNGAEIFLTFKEFSILKLLMQSPEHVFGRDALLAEVWGYDFDGETRTVDVHMRTLRSKLGAAAAQMQTVRGVGYRVSAATEQEQ
ncbi:MAG: response regulator transcription factor [Oscillospiraceae bacterium]